MAIETIFTELMFGSLSYLMLLIFLAVIWALVLMRKELAALMLPLSVIMGLEYLTNSLGWHAIFMFLNAIFIMLFVAMKKSG